jgi:hypothetical protein
MATEKSTAIFDTFSSYIENGNKKLIEKYNLAELELALCEYSANIGRPFYIAIQNRVNELKEKRKSKEKWIDRIWGFVTGLITGLIIARANGCLHYK